MSPVQFSSQFSLLRNFLSLKENLSSKQKLLESLLKFPVQFRGGAGDNQIITCSLAAAAVYAPKQYFRSRLQREFNKQRLGGVLSKKS